MAEEGEGEVDKVARRGWRGREPGRKEGRRMSGETRSLSRSFSLLQTKTIIKDPLFLS